MLLRKKIQEQWMRADANPEIFKAGMLGIPSGFDLSGLVVNAVPVNALITAVGFESLEVQTEEGPSTRPQYSPDEESPHSALSARVHPNPDLWLARLSTHRTQGFPPSLGISDYIKPNLVVTANSTALNEKFLALAVKRLNSRQWVELLDKTVRGEIARRAARAIEFTHPSSSARAASYRQQLVRVAMRQRLLDVSQC